MQANWMPICAGPWAIFDAGENSEHEDGRENVLSEMMLIAKGFLVFVFVIARTERCRSHDPAGVILIDNGVKARRRNED